MAISDTIRTYFNGTWHDGDVPVMRAADQGAWLGSSVFDGARMFDGVMPDLEAHCARVNASAKALMIEPTVSVEDMVALVREGMEGFAEGSAVYIRPMYWGIDGDATAIVPGDHATGFATVSVADVYRDIRDIAQRLDVPERGEALVSEMAEELGDGAPPEPAPGAPAILIQWWPKPVISPGRLSWAHEAIVLAGGRNPLDEAVKSRPLTNREVAEMAPDAIVLSWCGVRPEKYRPDVVLQNPDFAEVPAVRRGQVHCVGEPFLGRPGPRLVDGVRRLREVVAACVAASPGER